MSDEKKCKNCKHYIRTRCCGGKGGKNLACRFDKNEYYSRPQITEFSRSRTPNHPCHRPEQFEKKEPVQGSKFKSPVLT